MKIKKKLFVGFGLLFVVVLIFGAVSLYYIEVISETSNVTLKDNYATLTYTKDMRTVLDNNDLPLSRRTSETFDNALKKQENNITEPGEREATVNLRKAFNLLIDPSQSIDQKRQAEKIIRLQILKIEELNMQAIVFKNNYTHETVSRATLYLEGVGFTTFLILFILIANFPGFIINPLHEFAEGIEQISQKNYDIRLELKTSDEFAELADDFNTMAARLSEWENDSLEKIISEQLRIKTLIEEMPDAVIGIDEKQKILFINAAARKILSLEEKNVVGQSVQKFIGNNNLLKIIVENKDTENPLKINRNGEVSYFKQKSFEIVAPNLKTDVLDPLQYAGHTVGMIYILKNVTEFQET
jgi:nitrogen fixation/metabolism regulation signal transduction histidine kinase